MRKMKLKITYYFTQIHEIVEDLMGLVFSEGSFKSQNLLHHFICLFMKIFSYLYSQQCKWHVFDGVDVNKSMLVFFLSKQAQYNYPQLTTGLKLYLT